MRNPPLATPEAMSGYRAAVWPDDPPMACVTLDMLVDMHEAMDVEQENDRRAYDHARKQAENKGRR
jgi:hypothetical protein